MNQDFKNVLRATVNKLRGSVDPSNYKYPVLGLIFLKYISESFLTRQSEVSAAFADLTNEFYLEDESFVLPSSKTGITTRQPTHSGFLKVPVGDSSSPTQGNQTLLCYWMMPCALSKKITPSWQIYYPRSTSVLS